MSGEIIDLVNYKMDSSEILIFKSEWKNFFIKIYMYILKVNYELWRYLVKCFELDLYFKAG